MEKFSGTERSPLARLVLFMVCLSIAATIIAGVSCFTHGQQPAPLPPANGFFSCTTYTGESSAERAEAGGYTCTLVSSGSPSTTTDDEYSCCKAV
jgi:hypothetical protein